MTQILQDVDYAWINKRGEITLVSGITPLLSATNSSIRCSRYITMFRCNTIMI